MEDIKFFELKDIKPQLTEDQIKELEHIIYLTKATEKMQSVKTNSGLNLIIFPTGKMINANILEEIEMKKAIKEKEKEIKKDLESKFSSFPDYEIDVKLVKK